MDGKQLLAETKKGRTIDEVIEDLAPIGGWGHSPVPAELRDKFQKAGGKLDIPPMTDEGIMIPEDE